MKEFAFFLTGVTVTIVLSPWFRELVAKLTRRPSWRTFYRNLTTPDLIRYLSQEATRPDIIVGLNNGIVGASILATNFEIEELYYFHSFPKYLAGGGRVEPTFTPRDIEIADKNVLVVDDQIYSGGTMRALCQHLRSLEGGDTAKIVRFAVFRYKNPLWKEQLEIPSRGELTGAIKSVPWILVDAHEIRATHRDKLEGAPRNES